MTDDNEHSDSSGIERRVLLAAASGLSLPALMGSAAAQTGKVGTDSNPYQSAYVTEIKFESRTSDPSSPDNGEMWYRSDV